MKVLAHLAALALVTTGIGTAIAQPSAGTPPTLPGPCMKELGKAAQWFVRELDVGAVSVEGGAGWRAWRGTTRDEDRTLPVLWIRIEAIDPSSRSAGAVSGWIEVSGAPPGMSLAPGADDALSTVLPDTHYERSTGRWRIIRALVDGTPKEQAIVLKALDRCALELSKPPKPKPRR